MSGQSPAAAQGNPVATVQPRQRFKVTLLSTAPDLATQATALVDMEVILKPLRTPAGWTITAGDHWDSIIFWGCLGEFIARVEVMP